MSEEQHPLHALPRGHRLGEYELVRVLGVGGFGMTYLGFDHHLDKAVAIKEYLPSDIAARTADHSVAPQTSGSRGDFQWGLERFLDEARTLARFDHPHIVKVYRFFEAHGTAYIVMEYAEGETLLAYLTRKRTLSEAELKALLYPLLDGLEEVHKADFLHRDIKPGNIVLRDTDGSPVLLDFGAARQAIGAKSRSVTSIVTPGYAPIEQYSSRGRQGAWTDIYALGGVCYRALTGDVPDDATDRVRHDPLVSVSQRCASRASQAFLAAIDKALVMDERDRPQSIEAWRAAMGADAIPQHERRPSLLKRYADRVSQAFLAVVDKALMRGRQDASNETADALLATQSAAKVKEARRLNRWFKLHYICLTAIIPVLTALFAIIAVAFVSAEGERAFKDRSRFLESQALETYLNSVFGLFGIIVAIVTAVFGLIAFVSGLRILHKLWSLISAHKAKTTPSEAVGFFFIPLFGFYWNFIAIYGLARALNAEIGRKSVSEVASFIYCCSFLLGPLWGIMGWREDQIWMLLIGYVIMVVLWCVILRQMRNAGMLILQSDEA